MLRRLIAFVCMLALCAWLPGALAEDCFTIDVDLLDMDSLNSDDYVARELCASTQGVRVRKYISQSSELAAPVRLTLTQMDSQTLVFDKDYGYWSGTFDSGVIYLPYVDDRTIPYLVTLYVGDYVYAMPFMHRQARLTQNSACTRGVRLRDMGAGSDWLMGTMIDLSQGSRTVDVCASNSYVIGQATVSVSGGQIKVDVAFQSSADVDVSQMALYVSTDCTAFAGGQRGPAYSVGQWVDVSGADTALIYLPMQVSYDPSGLTDFQYDANGSEVQEQKRLWQHNAGSAETAPVQEESNSWADDAWADDGWTDGWNSGSGWDDGWNSDADGWMSDPGSDW